MPSGRPTRSLRLGVLSSHVIQYQAPLFRALAATSGIDLEVLFCSRAGVDAYWDPGFGESLRWDVPLLDGYRSTFMKNVSPRPGLAGFFGLVNPGVLRRVGDLDALLVHGWMHCTSWLAMLRAFQLGVPVLLRTDTTLFGGRPRWKEVPRRRLLRWLFRRISGFPAIGRHNAEFYEAYGVPPKKIVLAPFAVDNDFFLGQASTLAPEKKAIKEELGIEADTPVILFAGKLIGAKRPFDLLDSFERISRRCRAALVYAGDGALAASLKQSAAARGIRGVHFLGFRNQTELPRCYAAADALVLPSMHDRWGLVVNEAMCFGLPIVVSDRVGSKDDLVIHGRNGFVVPVGDLARLSDALETLLGDDGLRWRMGAASREIIAGWSHREAAAGIVRCLNEVVTGKWR